MECYIAMARSKRGMQRPEGDSLGNFQCYGELVMDRVVIFSQPLLRLCERLLNFPQLRLRLSVVTKTKMNAANN